MQTIKTIKKYLTTDGMEFLNLDTAIEHQEKIEVIGKSVEVGDKISFVAKDNNSYSDIDIEVTRVELPLIFTTRGGVPILVQNVVIYDVKKGSK